MDMRKSLFLLMAFLLASAIVPATAIHADWAYQFVVNKGKAYVITDERVEQDQVGKRVGKVTAYSDQEGTYSGNFSNTYPKGTEYYAIQGMNVNEAIAVKIGDGSYVKAGYNHEYAGSRFAISWTHAAWYAAGAFLLLLVFLIVKVNRR